MADNPNLNPQDVKAVLKDILKESGDFNDILKESIRSISSLSKAYDEILSKVDSLNKTSINIKQLENELYKAKQRDLIVTQKLGDLDRKLSQEQKNSVSDFTGSLEKIEKKKLEIQKATAFGDKAALIELEKQLGFLISSSDKQKSTLDTQEAQYIALKQQNTLAKESLDLIQKELTLEKQVSKQLGISGNLIKIFAEKLGVGTDAYENMTFEARKLVDVNEKITNLGKWKVAATGIKSIFRSAVSSALDPAVVALLVSKLTGTIGNIIKPITSGAALSKTGDIISNITGQDSANNVSKLTKGISTFIKNIPLVGGALGGIVDLMSGFLDFSINSTSQIQKLGRELGLSSSEALKLNNQFSNYSNNSSNVLLNAKKLFETQIELSNQLGIINTLSNKRLETDIQLKQIAGLDVETRGSLVQSSVILGKNQKDILNSVFAQVKGLKQATGIQLNQKQILGEVSKLGGFLGLTFAKYPSELSKSLVAVKSMGLELKQVDSIASSFLDFESSITSEFEAQVLTGKQINLNKARELFLNNNIAEAAAEINSQIGDASSFLKLNRIQAESLAQAFGMSRDDMADMLKKQEFMAKIGAKQTDDAKTQYELAVKKYTTQKAMASALGEEATQAIISANANERIANFIDKIKQGFVDIVSNSGISGFIDKALNFLSSPDSIKKIVNGIKDFFAIVLDVTGSVVGGIMQFLNMFPGIDIDEDLIETVKTSGDKIRFTSLGNLQNTESIGDIKMRSEMNSKKQSDSLIPAPVSNRIDSNNKPIVIQNNFNVDGQKYVSSTTPLYNMSATQQIDGQYGKNANQSFS